MLFVLTRRLKTVVVFLTFSSLIAPAQVPLPSQHKRDIALWGNLLPKVEAELARHQMVCDSARNLKVRVAAVADLTGDGVPEAVINWCNGGAYTDWLILMRLENGRPVLARSRENGKYSSIGIAYGTSAMHSAGYEFHPEQHAIYTFELDIGGWTEPSVAREPSVAKEITAHVKVYVWNPKTKTFDWNRKLSKQESDARTDKKPSRPR